MFVDFLLLIFISIFNIATPFPPYTLPPLSPKNKITFFQNELHLGGGRKYADL
jgi:hypothetical protein